MPIPFVVAQMTDAEPMEAAAQFRLAEQPEGLVVELFGDWTTYAMGAAAEDLASALASQRPAAIDLTGIGRLDTAGAFTVVRASRGAGGDTAIRARPASQRLITLVEEAMARDTRPPVRRRTLVDVLDRHGRAIVDVGRDAYSTLAFGGHLLVVAFRALLNPGRIRWAASISLAERAGLDAIPIIATTSFFIGAVVGLLGANMLQQFGAQVFAVELIGIAVMREFNIIITAVLLAGRSASSFAAEIGSMKMNQEVDAIKVLGVDPFDALVLPRFFAMLLTLPLLTFVATLAGLLGGMLVTWSVLDLGPAFFLQRILDNVGATHFWIGLSKAPVMAMAIAGIGCRQGLEVGGDVESLGRRVTAAVVHAIFAIIFIDALFALLYMELDL